MASHTFMKMSSRSWSEYSRSAGDSARVLSLFVARGHRKKNVGSTILAHLEKALAREGCTHVNLAYRSNWPSVPAIERLLQKRKWTSPQTSMLLGKTTTRRIAEAPWFDEASLPDGFTVFPWPELTPQEREAIQQEQEAEQWYSPVLTPFQEEERLEPLNSLGLRYQDRVVGWVITHRTGPDTIQYTSLFVQPEFQGQGRALPLLAKAIRRQVAVGDDVPYGIFQVEVVNEPMIKFVDRYLRPYLTSLTELRRSRKSLGPETGR
jgi:GNAT superfamily N-acetyltransferase